MYGARRHLQLCGGTFVKHSDAKVPDKMPDSLIWICVSSALGVPLVKIA